MVLVTLIAAAVLVCVIYLVFSPDPPPIEGVYSQPGKFYNLKYWIFSILLSMRKRQNRKQKSVVQDQAGWGMRSKNSIEEMDRAQQLPPQHPQAVDAVYFNGGNKDGSYMVAATARRHNNLVQTMLYIRLPELGLLELPSLPDTSLYQSKTETPGFSAGGLRIEPVTPMKKWKLSFEGKMRLVRDGWKEIEPDAEQKPAELLDVKFSLDWDAYTRMFDFDTDMHPSAICSAMAIEPWSRNFFNQLKVAHQTHYEQFGTISGIINLGSLGEHHIKVRGVRDHSYGNIRDWADLHRYALSYIHLENGTAIAVGMICMPRTLSRLPMGYVIKPDGSLKAISDTTLELYKFGEDGNPPTDFEFTFDTDENIGSHHPGDTRYHVKGHVLESPIFYMGLNWEARIHERFCTFNVNGVYGWGVSEWDYRNTTGKSKLYKNNVEEKLE